MSEHLASSERAYTAADLLEAAAAQDVPASARLITDWVAKGLLDHPRRRGRGRGKGIVATWPEHQRRLFLALLKQRRRVKGIRALCNIPVAAWLRDGPEYVPIRQVRRALTTWGSAPRATPARAARHAARIAAAGLEIPSMSRRDRAALIDAIANVAAGGTFDRDTLLAAVRRVFDLADADHTLGPPRTRLTPAGWVSTIEARLAALDSLGALDDRTFELAWLSHHTLTGVLTEYLGRQPPLARDLEAGALLVPAEDDYLANYACLELLTVIGSLELAGRRKPASGAQSHSGSAPRRIDSRISSDRAGTARPAIPNKCPGGAPTPRGAAHGKETSACERSVPPPITAASPSPTATASRSTYTTGISS